MSKQTQTRKEENNAQPQEQKLFSDTNVSMKTGHLTKDAEVISDGKFVRVRIATNKQYPDKDGNIQSTVDYFNALVSKNLAETFELAKTFKKGDWVYLKGEDHTKIFDTPEGYQKTETTIFAYKVTLKKEKRPAPAVQPS